MLQCHPKCMMALQLNCKPTNYILFFFTFCFLSLSLLPLHLLSLSQSSSLITLSLISCLSFLFKACTRARLDLWSQRGFWILDWRRSEIVVGCVWIGELCGSWVRWWVQIGGSMYRGSCGGVGLDRWRLVGFSMEIGGFSVAWVPLGLN